MATRNGYRIAAFCFLPAFAWHRLAVRLHDLGIRRVSPAYFGTAPLDRAGLAEFTNIDGREPVGGYVAVSARTLVLTGQSIYPFNLTDAH